MIDNISKYCVLCEHKKRVFLFYSLVIITHRSKYASYEHIKVLSVYSICSVSKFIYITIKNNKVPWTQLCYYICALYMSLITLYMCKIKKKKNKSPPHALPLNAYMFWIVTQIHALYIFIYILFAFIR